MRARPSGRSRCIRSAMALRAKAAGTGWLLANDRPGGVPDAQFGVSNDAGFSYFAKMVYDHSEKYPKGTMGSFSRDRLPEVLLREIRSVLFLLLTKGRRSPVQGFSTWPGTEID